MNIEILEIQRDETIQELKNLHETTEKIENFMDQVPSNSSSFNRLNACKKELETEIGWTEIILQEINDGITFDACKKE